METCRLCLGFSVPITGLNVSFILPWSVPFNVDISSVPAWVVLSPSSGREDLVALLLWCTQLRAPFTVDHGLVYTVFTWVSVDYSIKSSAYSDHGLVCTVFTWLWLCYCSTMGFAYIVTNAFRAW